MNGMRRNPWTVGLWAAAGVLLAAGVIMIADSSGGGVVDDPATGWAVIQWAVFAALAAAVVSALTWQQPSQGVGEPEHAEHHSTED